MAEHPRAIEDEDPEWYWGEISKAHVDKYLSGTKNGTFLVFQDGSDDMLTLAFREKGRTEYMDIIFRDHMYGFTEPLGFETLADVLDAYNWSPHTSETLKYAAKRTEVLESRKHHTVVSGQDQLSMLKRVKETSKLYHGKEVELEDMHTKIKTLDEVIEEQYRSAYAFAKLLKILDTQMKRHQSLSQSPSVSADNADALSENYGSLISKKSEINAMREIKEAEIKDTEEEKRTLSKKYIVCRSEVEQFQTDLEDLKSVILSEYPELNEFLQCLLWDDTLTNTEIPILNVTNDTAKRMLMETGDEGVGAFIVRNSKKKHDMPYIICVRSEETVLNFPVLKLDGYYGLDPTTCIFDDIYDVISGYTKIPFGVHDEKYGDLTLGVACNM